MSVTQPTHDWDFRQTVSAGGTVKDNINGTFATYNNGLTSDSTNGLDLTGTSANKFASLAPFNTGTEFSMEFYFQKTAHAGSHWPFLIHITSNPSSVTSGDNFFALSWDKDTEPHDLYSRLKGTSGTVDTILIDDANVYAHFVVTFNDTTKELKQYLNGSLVLTDTINKSFTDTTYTYNYVGATPYSATRQFNCYLYYFRYWKNGILSSSEISTLYANRATTNYFGTEPLPIPTHDWDFRQTVSAGGTIGDNINGTTATLTGVTADATNGAAFTNSNHTDYIALTPFNTGTEFSMEFYFQKLTVTSSNWPVLIQMSNATGYNNHWCYFQHDKTNNDLQTAFNGNSSYGKSDSTNLIFADNDYVHFVVTWNDNSKELNHYLNGSLVDTVTLSGLSLTDTTNTYNHLGNTSLVDRGYNANFYYFRYWKNGILSSSDVGTLYANRSTINYFSLANMRINYGDVYLAQNLIKTLAEYKAENIPLQDVSFGAFPANKYKQSYIKDLLDVSGSFIQRQHIFYSDMSFNVSDLSADQVIVNNDLSLNIGINIFHDSSLNSNVGIVGDLSINGTLTIENNSIPESALNFTKPASNFGTFDSTQDVSMGGTFILQGDYERFIDLSQNIQTDFSENIVMIPSSLGLDLSGGTATLSGKTGDQAFLNGTYILKDNSGNTTGNIYDDFNENTAATPGQLSATPDYYWDFRVATPSGNTLADRVSGINATYYGGITSSETTGVSFTERSGWSSYTGETQSQYVAPGDIIPGTDFTIEYYIEPSYTFDGFGQIHNQASTSDGSIVALACVYYSGGMNINVYLYPASGASYNVMTHSGTGNVYSVPYNTPAHVVVSYDNLNTVFKIYINGSLWSITYDDSSRATGATAENTSYGYASGTALPNAKGHIICDDNKIGAISLTSPRPFEGNYYYLRHYKDKILTDADVATLYANASTINWDFQTVVNNNKLTSLPKNWNAFQFQNGGGWLYDGSSNYTSYLDQYGRPQTVKGDNYDLTLPFHFYPSKAFLRTIPILPASSSINPHNYPASVKFFGKSQHNDLSSNFYLLGEFENKATIVSADSSANYTHNSVVYNSSENYVHGADFLYNLNRKYYVNQLRMIVDKAPDSSGNSYGEYHIDRLAYSGSSFSGKKMESNNPNLYLNTAYDISYGFTEDHSNSVYDLSYNKNQFSILDVSGGGVIQVNPTIKLEDSSLNTEKITSSAKIGVHYENKFQTLVSSFNNDFYNYLGIRDASGLYNNRISNDGKTIVTLNNRGTEAYDASNAEVVFSTDYGKNWKDVLQDCSDTFLFNENDISYNLLFATGDASGAIDIATSGNGKTMYVGRQSNVFTIENNYSGLGATSAPQIAINETGGFPQSMWNNTMFPFGTSTSSASSTLSSGSNRLGITEAEGSYTISVVGGSMDNSGDPPRTPRYMTQTQDTNAPSTSRYSRINSFTNTSLSGIDANGNTSTYSLQFYLKYTWPSTIYLHPTESSWWIFGSYTVRVFGLDINDNMRYLGAGSYGNSYQTKRTLSLNNTGDGIKELYYGITGHNLSYCNFYNLWFRGMISYGEGNPGIPIPTSGVPEIYTTNYGNSWKLSPFKFHSGPTIISGDGSTILLLQQHKLNNDRHGYVSSLGNETSSIDCHWLTTDYGATWRTLNRSGHDASNNIIPPSYGSKTATFFKACMSYSGQYIYIYNVQCTTNSNYGELYYSHDYGVTFNKWVTSEAQTVITGTGQISCSGSGKYVYIAGTNASSAFVYYRSTDYGLSFNKDITKFPWQSYTLSESSTSAGPFISYEGDLIVTAGSNTTVTTGNSDLQYSLDYGVNYNDLSLNSDTISNITNSFTNLPNKTNTLFTTTDASTKTGIFANSPGPNEYKFLTNILGRTDVSNIYLQTIEFPKENPTKTIENEGPVFFTSEEPIDKENDFGQNISNSSIGSNKLWNIAVSEDGQKLLGGGAVDISNGAFYAGYNLTNAKFPPTEKVVTDAIPTPAYYWDFRRSTDSEAQVDTIQQKSFYTWQGVNVSTTTGAVVDDLAPTDSLVINNITLDTNYTIELFYKKNANSINSPSYNALFQLNSPSEIHYNMGNIWYRALQGAIWIHSNWTSSNSGEYPYNDTAYAHVDDTEYHLVLVFNSDTNTFTEYRNNSVFHTHTSLRTGQQHTYEIFTLGGATGRQASSNGTTSGQEPTFVNRTSLNQEGNYYYLRFYNTALTANHVNTLFNGKSTVDYNNWTSYTNLANIPHFKTANLSYDGNQALLVPYGITQTTAQNLYYWTASGDFHRFEGKHMSNFDAENWKFGKLSGDGNFFVGFTHSSTALSDTNYNSDTWWTDPVSNTMIIYKTMQKISKGTVADATATTEAGGTTYDLNNAFASDSGVTSYHITHVNVSETGQYILIVGGNSTSTYTNRCAFSSDFGITFTDISSKFSFTDVTKALVYCHVSDNGRYLFISQYNSNEYCFSADYGNTFTLRNTFPSSTKTYGVVSRDGQNALFVDTNKYAYTSVNGNFRQEAIPALSGVNSGLSLTHNNWKYTSTLSEGNLIYNPSMPNIKYFLGTEEELVTTPTFYWDFRQTVSAGGTVTDSISGNIATLSSSNATCTTSGGLTIPSNNATSGTGYADFQAFTTNSNGFSLEMYYYAGSTSWNATPFHIGNSTSSASDNLIFGVFLGSGTYQHYHIINDTYTNANSTMNDNQIYHIVITLDAINSVYTIYNDGVQVFQATDGTGFTNGTFPVISSKNFNYNRIGARADSKRGLNGNCYYFRFWNGTAITSSEVSTLYANRTTTNYTFKTNKLTSSNVRYTGSYFSELDIKGSLTNLSGTGYTSSDYRVKKNVTSLDEADTIANLVPVSYTQNNLHHKKAVGFIAHDFSQSFPDLVTGEKDGPEMQSVNYNGVIAILIKEIQTLRANISQLRTKIKKLKSEI